jgi:pimeloyl-ACP methyl ester carboxylesterase/class 3 adenylate cyclase
VQPTVRFTKSGDVNIAYGVVGDGPVDLVWVPGWVSHLEIPWEDPSYARFLDRLASFSRLIVFDKRGTGLSDRVPVSELPNLEQRMDDVRAVMDAAGSERAVLFGASEGGPMSALFAATYPERTQAVIMYGAYASFLAADGYPWGWGRDAFEQFLKTLEELWDDLSPTLFVWAPSVSDDPGARRYWTRFIRMGASPAAINALTRMNAQVDIRDILPSVRVPTLVIHRKDDRLIDVASGRYLAEHIPGAKFVELPGHDHLWWWEDPEGILSEVEEFVTGVRPTAEHERVLATVMFTDVVGSTERAASMGDRRWRDLLENHNTIVRSELVHYRGKEVDTAGDGFLATFDGPARGIRCGMAIAERVRDIGLEVRVGLHTGELEVAGDDVRGIAVHTGARIAALAEPGEVLVSSTVKDLVAGSGLTFEDRGVHALKGVPGKRRLFRAHS